MNYDFTQVLQLGTSQEYGDDVTCVYIKNNQYMIVECEEEVTCVERGG